jgi:hypothetical protein
VSVVTNAKHTEGAVLDIAQSMIEGERRNKGKQKGSGGKLALGEAADKERGNRGVLYDH